MANDLSKTHGELMAEVQFLRHQVEQLRAGAAADALHAALANLNIMVFAFDCNGLVTLSEGRALEHLGLKPGEAVGRSVQEVFCHWTEAEGDLYEALKGYPQCTTVTLADVVFEVCQTPMRDADGKIVGVAAMVIDVTACNRTAKDLSAEQSTMEQLLQSHEQDRRMMAYEIHDGLVQDATGAQMQLESLLHGDNLPPGPVRDRIRLARDLVGKAIVEARQLIGGLRPPILDELGMVPAIEYLIENRESETPSIDLTVDVTFDRLESLLEVTAYRIVQEALANAVRHSRSDRVAVRLTQVGDRFHIEIQDWGVGFSPGDVVENRFGLQGIRERARLLRGRVAIESAPGQGTRVFVDLPVAHAL